MLNVQLASPPNQHKVLFSGSLCRAEPARCVRTYAREVSKKRRKGRVEPIYHPLHGQPLQLKGPDTMQSISESSGIDESELLFEVIEDDDDMLIEEGYFDGPDEQEFAVAMARIAYETKAEDIRVLRVGPLIYWTGYMVIATVYSRPQLNAVLGRIEKEAAEKWGRTVSEGGRPGTSEWEVLDLHDCVVHVFTEREREFYDLEGFYKAAEQIELPFVLEGVSISSSPSTLSLEDGGEDSFEQTADSLEDEATWTSTPQL
mmetsp:Transcript_5850/g.16700  ORF Transcript_5850/g.16700 Transcript_5850/m.16700 type:complete len:259 (+) Transcript_5850:197-973(+)